ncbi:MAG TPA: C-GCAxxG-C-C family protein [Clostridia bacterium]|nr:C-GCAxxG-C-C family protein [Clostridia bacterium]
MKNKERCIQRARELGAEYQLRLVGCGHSSYSAILDALREEGIELVSPETQDEVFKSVIGLTGGCGNMHEGTCGAVMGAAYAIGLAVGIDREEQENDGGKQTWLSSYEVKKGVADKFIENYGSIVCRDIMFSRWGMSFCSHHEGRSKEFFACAEKCGCRNPQECVISTGAAFGVETIWDYIENKGKITFDWENYVSEENL